MLLEISILSFKYGSFRVVERIYTRTHRYTLDFSMWVSNCEVVEEEHAMERFGEELNLQRAVSDTRDTRDNICTYHDISTDQDRQPDIVRGVRALSASVSHVSSAATIPQYSPARSAQPLPKSREN